MSEYSKQDSSIFWDAFSFIFWIILNQVLISLSWPTHFSLLLWDCRPFIWKLVHQPFTNFESLLHEVGYAKHTSQNILLSVNLTHRKALVLLTDNYWQRFSSLYLHFTSAWRFSLWSFSALRCTSSPSLTTMTSSAFFFYVFTKYFNNIHHFSHQIWIFIMANHVSWWSVWSYHLIHWLIYTTMFNCTSYPS